MVQIGAKPESDFDDPVGMLSDCHRRVENFLRVLALVAQKAEGRELSEEQRRAFTAALRYFREAAPKHTADEEESLFPRLRQLDSQELQRALAHVERLEADHRAAAPDHELVDRLGEQWLAVGTLAPADFEQLLSAILRLDRLYSEHIAVEDQQLFPLAKRQLSREAQLEVGREMAERRGIERG